MNGAALRLSNSIDSILEDKELMKMHVDLQKRFPIYHVCPKCLAAFSAARRYERMPQHPFRYRMRWERHWSTGNVGISTAN